MILPIVKKEFSEPHSKEGLIVNSSLIVSLQLRSDTYSLIDTLA